VFGKSIIKLIGLLFAGAIAIAGGAELLVSVVGVVIAFRTGNPLPLILIISTTIVILRAVKTQKEETPTKLILNIVGYATTVYLMVVAFVIALPYGLFVSIAIAITTAILISFIGDPSTLLTQVRDYVPSTMRQSVSRRVVQTGDGSTFTVNSSNTVIIINSEHRNKVVDLMRERLLLPISLTHFEELDVLFVSAGRNHSLFDRVISLLSAYGVETQGTASALLSEAIQMIPIIDQQNGLPMKEYRLARDEKTVQDLLLRWPSRMTIFPSEEGLRVLVPEMEVIGYNVEPLKKGFESDVLLYRDFTSTQGVRESIESTT
jgi:hypothetical protein